MNSPNPVTPPDERQATVPLHPDVAARLARLFRHTLRNGDVNPLMYLVRRWRGGGTP